MSTVPVWVGALATILLAIIAVFQDRIRRWIMNPRLDLRVRVAPPDCHRTIWNTAGRQFPCYYFRLGVVNSGKVEAREVEIFAAGLNRARKDGSFEAVPRFTPMNLVWSHIRVATLPILIPEMPKYCDLAHVFAPQHRNALGHSLPNVDSQKSVLAFDLQVEPNMLGHLAEPGTYHLSLVMGAANAPVRRYTLEINFPGDWFDDEARMLREGFGMRIL